MKHPKALCQNHSQVIAHMWQHYEKSVHRYSFWSMVYVLLGRRQTVASSSTKVPSYAWCEFIQEDGEISVAMDRGRLPHYIRAWNHKKGDHSGRRYMINTLCHWLENSSAFEMISNGENDDEDTKVKWMLENGIALHQPFIVASHFSAGGGWEDDYDESMECDILFVDQEPATTFFPLYPAKQGQDQKDDQDDGEE